jgi:type I restriction enzyme R subunit
LIDQAVKAQDILEHYRTTIEPNGFKAQVVTISRAVAVSYVEALRQLGAPECALIMSTSNNDPARLQRHHLSSEMISSRGSKSSTIR